MKQSEERYKTILIITLGVLIWYFLEPRQSLLILILVLVALSSISSLFCLWIHIGWMKLAEILGYIMPNILLTIIYFVLLYPMAKLAKIFRSEDPLQLKNFRSTTFIVRNKIYMKDDLINPW
ncbi:hypothetical protein [Sediminibacterium sp.]|uniref:hypothetical protein n=1 Tax=Sediminibacterium sp. TaxID=1917865 RepID=UPI002733CCA1|nr:hypothetical protein [Sediminibacterium sp.]MDP3392418.1 hypothetical protein [Sediminibacterium sp.]MDP3565684.1 hypothetical protein [Sediminibacterium sp.]